MPTYEYACASCGNQWEEFQRITDAPLEDCPACQAKSAQRQISGGNFILKGGGWYADLYSSAKPGKKSDDSGSSGSSGATGSGSSTPASGSSGTSGSSGSSSTKGEPRAA